MRKLTVLAMLAATLMVGPAFARSTHNLMPTPNATFSPGVGGAASGPSTTNNDDTCDISVAPAATLLLPYFEVDFKSSAATARTTLFTITNVSPFGLSSDPTITNVPGGCWQTSYDFKDIFSWVRATHTLKMGGQLRRPKAATR